MAQRIEFLQRQSDELTTEIDTLTTALNPALRAAYGVGPDTAAQLLITAGTNSNRLRSEAAFAMLSGVAPIPASSGKTTRHRLSRGGDRAANNALHRIALVRWSHDPRTRDYVARQLAAGRSKKDVLRLLKRAIAREMFKHLTTPCPIDDYSDLRPTRQAKKHHPHRSRPTIRRLAQRHLPTRTRTQTRRHPRRQLPPMAQHPAHRRRLTLNRDRSIKRPREKWSGLVIGALPSASWGHLHRSRGGIPTRNNTTAEVYWYGTRWHGRRNKLANSVGGETASPVAGGKSSTARTWIVVGLAVCVAIIVTLIFALGPSPYERECKNSALRQGLQGLQYEEVVKVCVDLKEKGY